MHKIRSVRVGDLDTLANLDKIASLTPWSLENYTASLNNRSHSIYILEQNRQILGCIVIGVAADEGEILQFWVKKEEQNKGYGKILLKDIVRKLQERQINNLFLEVRSDNIFALQLYVKLGFKNVGIRKNYYTVDGVQFDAITMLLQLMR